MRCSGSPNHAGGNADAVRRDGLRDYVVEHLGDDRAVLVFDETRFLKKVRGGVTAVPSGPRGGSRTARSG
jgi:hypothetical protein